ncbi:hypothetical protein ACWEKM_19445 [Streptomyces sp. NPDC004752]
MRSAADQSISTGIARQDQITTGEFKRAFNDDARPACQAAHQVLGLDAEGAPQPRPGGGATGLHAWEQNRLSLRDVTGSGSEQKMYTQWRTRPARHPPYVRQLPADRPEAGGNARDLDTNKEHTTEMAPIRIRVRPSLPRSTVK